VLFTPLIPICEWRRTLCNEAPRRIVTSASATPPRAAWSPRARARSLETTTCRR
jgi:hypothetical protein